MVSQTCEEAGMKAVCPGDDYCRHNDHPTKCLVTPLSSSCGNILLVVAILYFYQISPEKGEAHQGEKNFFAFLDDLGYFKHKINSAINTSYPPHPRKKSEIIIAFFFYFDTSPCSHIYILTLTLPRPNLRYPLSRKLCDNAFPHKCEQLEGVFSYYKEVVGVWTGGSSGIVNGVWRVEGNEFVSDSVTTYYAYCVQQN